METIDQPVLAVEKLEVVYQRAATAIQGVSLAVPRGRTVALLGNNGAGKTTTLRAISGFIGRDDARITEGTIHLAGRRIDGAEPHRTAALGMILVPERDKVFENLTVTENLEASVARRPGRSHRRAQLDLVHGYFPALGPLARREAGYLSGGERQMLAIGTALMCDPVLLLVDELSLGLSPIIVREITRSPGSCAASSRSRTCRCCSSSRTPRWRSTSPTTPTSSRTAASSSTARPSG
jgi:branched-chain amino acid transport system ATP-binding protein